MYKFSKKLTIPRTDSRNCNIMMTTIIPMDPRKPTKPWAPPVLSSEPLLPAVELCHHYPLVPSSTMLVEEAAPEEATTITEREIWSFNTLLATMSNSDSLLETTTAKKMMKHTVHYKQMAPSNYPVNDATPRAAMVVEAAVVVAVAV